MKKKMIKQFMIVMSVAAMGSFTACGAKDSVGTTDVDTESVITDDSSIASSTEESTSKEEVEYKLARKTIVHSIIEEDGSVQKEAPYIYAYTYDEAGNILSELLYKETETNVQYKNEYVYNDSGKMIWQNRYMSEDTPHSKIEYVYDEAGRQIAVVDYNEDGTIYTNTEFIYDSSNNLVTELIYESDGALLNRMEYQYDESGRNIKKEYYYDEEELSYYDEYVYDEAGNMIKWASYSDSTAMNSWECTYNDAGNVIEKRTYNYVYTMDTVEKYEYDNQGKVVKMIESKPTGEEMGITEFTYDEWGNLVKEIYTGSSNIKEVTYEYVIDNCETQLGN